MTNDGISLSERSENDEVLWAIRMYRDPLTQSGGFIYASCADQGTAESVYPQLGGGAFGEVIVHRPAEDAEWEVWTP